MSTKPVVLLYDLDNVLVDECSALIGQSGLYTTINTYNETNAIEVIRQYNRGFGLLTNRLSCVITGWNRYKKPRDQLLFSLRAQEKRSALRRATPVILIAEDHRYDLRELALDPMEGYVSAYLHAEDFQAHISDTLHKIVFGSRAHELNSIAYAKLLQERSE
ncbi:MAG: hypothetical protein VXW45_07870 [Pseudomonadota bacterium]|nr:hypothetical protein [Pseudomonadota bacterium]MEC8700957.1 hypothetical protein [Pseudomonadota bacterium]